MRRLVLAARIIGFSTVGIGTAFIIREAVGQFVGKGRETVPPVWLIMILAMAIAGCVLS